MKPFVKQFGRAGVVLLVLNEIRGLVVVGVMVAGLGGAPQEAPRAEAPGLACGLTTPGCG